MAQRKLLSERYLNFLGKQGISAASGKRGTIELHHESVFEGFRGGRKKYNDYQALPLLQVEHVDRHTYGLAWWAKIDKDPVEIVTGLLLAYRDTLSPFSFKNELDYEKELEIVNELLEELGIDV